MNRLLENHISVEGVNNALEVAKVLMKNDYQVFIQLDDCDIYIISYCYNNLEYGSKRFAAITEEEEETILNNREDEDNFFFDEEDANN